MQCEWILSPGYSGAEALRSGNVALSADRRMKVVHNLTTDKFDVYTPPESTEPITLAVSGNTRRMIKGVSFTQDGYTLVCGGDGLVHLFTARFSPQGQDMLETTLAHEGKRTCIPV